MQILENIGVLARCHETGGQGEIHVVRDAVLAWEEGTIRYAGPAADFSGSGERIDAEGRLVVPGLVDCHTHLAFGGWRADEFGMRARGASYLDILKAGGGIRSTMRHTREATEDALLERSQRFLREMARLGVTTVEAKSGYGLSLEAESKQLSVYRRLAGRAAQEVVPTFLGAHVVPPEFGDAASYVDFLAAEVLPVTEAEFCDVFVEDGAFSAEDARRLFAAAASRGMRPKLHVDQLGDGGGGLLAAEVGAISADHLEYTNPEGRQAMAEAGVVAVTLPIASLYLRQPPMDARAFIADGCRVAVATDFNPGSAPSYHLPWAMTLACTMNRLTPAEALKGATLYAAAAVGRDADRGSLEAGKRADFVVVDADSVDQWLYHFVPNAAVATFIAGHPVR